jgi:protein-S-isoprenylcysteine O-methyltransferase Ste14
MTNWHREFTTRGGWWVLAQVPVMLGAFGVPMLWGDSPFDGANTAQIAGLALTLLGALLAIAGLLALGSALTPFPHPRDNATLRQSGLYGWVRHPIYGGIIISSFSWSAAWLSVPGLLCSLATLYFFNRKIAREERSLRVRFPDYSTYAARVKKLVPWIY